MRVVLTRPDQEARDWEEGLRAAGHEVLPLPLITIGPAPDPSGLVRCWAQLDDFNVVMFVSSNAVRQFFAAGPSSEVPGASVAWQHLRVWATGPGTARALQARGVPVQQIDMPAADAREFDSEALWQLVRGQVRVGTNVLIVRGVGAPEAASTGQGSGRNWLADTARAAGARVEFCVAYQRLKPLFAESQRVAVRQWVNGDVIWLFSSSEAIANLVDGVRNADWQKARALCTHARIAKTARTLGFGVVRESRPTLADVVASIESFR